MGGGGLEGIRERGIDRGGGGGGRARGRRRRPLLVARSSGQRCAGRGWIERRCFLFFLVTCVLLQDAGEGTAWCGTRVEAQGGARGEVHVCRGAPHRRLQLHMDVLTRTGHEPQTNSFFNMQPNSQPKRHPDAPSTPSPSHLHPPPGPFATTVSAPDPPACNAKGRRNRACTRREGKPSNKVQDQRAIEPLAHLDRSPSGPRGTMLVLGRWTRQARGTKTRTRVHGGRRRA